ncbi:MAG: glycosyltransferase [Verrucomicrobiota bacterium]
MPAFNAEDTIVEAVESVLEQNYEDFAFHIYDDGSTDSTRAIIERYTNENQNIVAHFSGENRGYVYALNYLIKNTESRFIARMDADDISMVTRFEKQVKVLEEHEHIDIVSCAAQTFQGEELGSIWKVPESNEEVFVSLIHRSPFTHSGTMMRRSAVASMNPVYREEYMPCEDYDLWSRLVNTSNSININQPLMKYRISRNQVSRNHLGTKQANRRLVMKSVLSRIVEASSLEIATHDQIMNGDWPEFDRESIQKAVDWFDKLMMANVEKRVFPREAFENLLLDRFFDLLSVNPLISLKRLWASFCFGNLALSKKVFLTLKTLGIRST